jgi:hypothetical protein
MITQLARLRPEQLAVIARATAMHYKGTRKRPDRIAHELKVDYLLEGSIRREGTGVPVTAQLIQASHQTHRWAQTYDRDLSNALALQSEVAGAIANEIHLALTPQTQGQLSVRGALDPAAYDDYLRGRYHISRPHPKPLLSPLVGSSARLKRPPATRLPSPASRTRWRCSRWSPSPCFHHTRPCRKRKPQPRRLSNSTRVFQRSPCRPGRRSPSL